MNDVSVKSQRSVWSSDDGPASDETAPVTVSGSSNLSWYIRLRWLAVSIQLVLVVVGLLGAFPLGSITPYIAVAVLTLASNMAARQVFRFTSMTDWVTFVLLSFDVVMLTLLLWHAGGPSNPLILLYVVHITLGAVMVPPALGWTVGALVIFCYGALFVLPSTTSGTSAVGEQLASSEQFRHHLLNQWWAFTGVAMLLAYFVTRVTRSLILRERELARFAQREARGEKMASLATLATGAAHELGTPLGTIGLVAGELERTIDRGAIPKELVEDARLIRSQVERCRAIIDSMRSEAGEGYEEPEVLQMETLMGEARDKLPPGYAQRIVLSGEFDAAVFGPRRSLCQAFRNLMKNALDASEAGQTAVVNGEDHEGSFHLTIRDFGAGIPSAVLKRVGEPFFTTKEAGRGMGLGLFVTQAVIERVGGRIRLESEPGVGTTVTVVLPVMGVAR